MMASFCSIPGAQHRLVTSKISNMLSIDNRTLFSLDANLTYLNHGGFGATPKSILAEKKRILDEIEKNPVEFLNRRKTPPSRPIKCACSTCGYTVHTTRKWLELTGAPLCPKHGQMDTEKMQSPTTL